MFKPLSIEELRNPGLGALRFHRSTIGAMWSICDIAGAEGSGKHEVANGVSSKDCVEWTSTYSPRCTARNQSEEYDGYTMHSTDWITNKTY